MSSALEIFHKFIIENFDPDPKHLPQYMIECLSLCEAAQFGGQEIISAMGPASFFAFKWGVTKLSGCLAVHVDDRTVEQKQAILSDQANIPIPPEEAN